MNVSTDLVADILRAILECAQTEEERKVCLSIIAELSQAFLAQDENFKSYEFCHRAYGEALGW